MFWEGGKGADVFIHKGWEWGIIEGWRGHEKQGIIRRWEKETGVVHG